ncbi:protein CMSS1 [Aplochiton taeniatus]
MVLRMPERATISLSAGCQGYPSEDCSLAGWLAGGQHMCPLWGFPTLPPWSRSGENVSEPEVKENVVEVENPEGEAPSQEKTGQKRKIPTDEPDEAKKTKKDEPEDSVAAQEKKPEEEGTEPKKRRRKRRKKECFVAQETKPEGNGTESKKPKRKRKKKTITDVLATAEPQPGCPADLQKVIDDSFAGQRSVIELEELKLQDSSFLPCNDLTHTLSSYLKEVCPKWAKVQKQHTEKSSVVLLVVSSSALRAIELIKQMTAFKGEAKVLKLFAKHIRVKEQVKLLEKSVTHIGVGTPARLRSLVENEGLKPEALRYLVLDWNWRDQKLRRMVDLPEIKSELLKLLDAGILKGCREGKTKIGLF